MQFDADNNLSSSDNGYTTNFIIHNFHPGGWWDVVCWKPNSKEDPEFWPDALKGEAAYLHKLAVRRTHAGRGVSSALIEACRHAARTQGCAKLRLDCHPNLRGLYERLGFTHVDTFNPGWDPTFIAERLELEI